MTEKTIDSFIQGLIATEPSLAWFGFEIEHAHQGAAIVTTIIRPEQINANGLAHGGVLFALADQSFAMAANTVINFAVTTEAQIQYLAPAHLGDTVVAEARVVYRDEKRVIVDVSLTIDKVVIALFRGTARAARRKSATLT